MGTYKAVMRRNGEAAEIVDTYAASLADAVEEATASAAQKGCELLAVRDVRGQPLRLDVPYEFKVRRGHGDLKWRRPGEPWFPFDYVRRSPLDRSDNGLFFLPVAVPSATGDEATALRGIDGCYSGGFEQWVTGNHLVFSLDRDELACTVTSPSGMILARLPLVNQPPTRTEWRPDETLDAILSYVAHR